jgi:hypothetical protein
MPLRGRRATRWHSRFPRRGPAGPRQALAPVSFAVLLVALQIFFAAAMVPSTAPIQLRSTDFRWFSSDPPGPISAGPTSWSLPVPGQARSDGKLAVDDAVSLASYHVGELAFTAAFLNQSPSGVRASQFADEMVVFATSNDSTYHGYEFGIRLSLADGQVYAYWQYPDPAGGVVFHEQPLFVNDGRPHAYALSLSGTVLSFTVDGTRALVALYPTFPPPAFYVVTTAHRESPGWNSTGLELSVSDITVRELSI